MDGKGHRSTIIEEGRSLIITADIQTQDEFQSHPVTVMEVEL